MPSSYQQASIPSHGGPAIVGSLSQRGPDKKDSAFGAVLRDPSLSDKVTKLITDAIVSGELRAGEWLDSERELAEQFGVSRTVIREAVRSLVAQGLIETKTGRGTRVSAIDGDTVARSMSLFLRGNPEIEYPQVHEVRSALEVEITGLAAERATSEDVSRLAQINDEFGRLKPSDERAASVDFEFHRHLAIATQNPLFVVVLDSISDVLLEIRRVGLSESGMIDYAQSAHGRILARVTARDVKGAREAMRTHLSESERAWLAGSSLG